MKVQLVIMDSYGRTREITNLLGISPVFCLHSVEGEMVFHQTKQVRIKGEYDNPKKIFEVIRRKDVEVINSDGQVIFQRPDWGVNFVLRMIDSFVPDEAVGE